ncbi:hypothetical protein [Halalkalibacter urbisdiaboli]|uniref:hypothetical protein n=1 Tax=Halalkalibacter urbisdiaboli TaxID=1960589 RepID=UPI000B44AF43|nr:hypothetical protein [Halalkalibacter urbisdiaboli]
MLIFLANSNSVYAANQVSVTEAKKVIQTHISDLESDHEFSDEWRNVDIEFNRNLYDIDDTVVSYYFSLVKDDKEVGYYIIAARDNLTPVLEYSNAASHEGFEEVPGDEKIYYFGGLNFTGALNKEKLKEKFKKSKDKHITNLEKELIDLELTSKNVGGDEKKEQKQKLEKELKANKELTLEKLKIKENVTNIEDTWEYYLKDQPIEEAEFKALSLPSSYWLGVPHMYQRQAYVSNPGSACGPTTAAMIAQYHYNNGHSYVRAKQYYGGNEWQLINTLRNELGVGALGLYESNFTHHFPRYLNYDNYSGQVWRGNKINGEDAYSLDTFKSRVVSGSPPPVMWHRFPWYDNASVTWHWQAGMAYRVTAGVTEFGVREPDTNVDSNKTKYYPYMQNRNDFLFIRLIRS